MEYKYIIMNDVGKELPQPQAGLIDKEHLNSLDQWAINPTLRIEPDILGQNKWQEMLAATQTDGNERGLTVAWDGKRLVLGKVSQGNHDSIAPDFFPRGIRSVFSRRERNLVFLHTHPMPPELNHIQTSPLSDKDINAFVNSTLKAMATIDRGGVHLLTRNPHHYHASDPDENLHPLEFTANAITKAKNNSGTVMEVMRETAKQLQPLGIKYYYSPNLTPQANGLIEIRDVLK